ncbi:MAG TPA: RidA family protein [Trueperaceae bacterium]
MNLRHINPDSMHKNPAFSQGVMVEGPGRLLVVGGQNGVDSKGEVVSADFGEQTKQALKNVLTVLDHAGATQHDVAKLTIFYEASQDVRAGFQASAEVWGPIPTAITVIAVPTFGRPGILVEIDALAWVSDTGG